MRMFLRSLTVLWALTLTPAAQTQDPNATRTIPVAILKYRVKPGSTGAFQDVMKKYREARKQTDRAFFLVWRTQMGDTYEYITMGDMTGLEAFDQPRSLAKAFGERGALDLSYRLSQCVDGVTRQMWHIHPEQSIWSEQAFRVARVTEIGLRDSQAVGEHNRAQTKVRGKQREKGTKNAWTLHLDYGGDDYRVLSIRPFDNYAEIGRDEPLSKLMGAGEAKEISAVRQKVTASRHVYLWSYLPDLSFRKSDLPSPK